MQEPEFNIVSAVLMAQPSRLGEVREFLLAQPGVEIHAMTDDGRLVVTVEGEHNHAVADQLRAFETIPGVLAVNPIYQYSEPVHAPSLEK